MQTIEFYKESLATDDNTHWKISLYFGVFLIHRLKGFGQNVKTICDMCEFVHVEVFDPMTCYSLEEKWHFDCCNKEHILFEQILIST